jgi:hypothetical protein
MPEVAAFFQSAILPVMSEVAHSLIDTVIEEEESS